MEPTQEQWRPILGYERLYEVSDQGRVRSLDRLVPGRYGNQRTARGRILKPGFTPESDYRHVHLSRDAVALTRSVHTLVAQAFLADPSPGSQVCHIDGDKANNAVSNLRYDTPSNNHWDKWRHGTMVHGEAASRVLTTEKVVEIRASREIDRILARRYGVSATTIRNVRGRKTWRWLADSA